jgi:hypothetical protein
MIVCSTPTHDSINHGKQGLRRCVNRYIKCSIFFKTSACTWTQAMHLDPMRLGKAQIVRSNHNETGWPASDLSSPFLRLFFPSHSKLQFCYLQLHRNILPTEDVTSSLAYDELVYTGDAIIIVSASGTHRIQILAEATPRAPCAQKQASPHEPHDALSRTNLLYLENHQYSKQRGKKR